MRGIGAVLIGCTFAYPGFADTVSVTQTANTITASNACVAFTVIYSGSGTGRMSSLKYLGNELLGHGGYGYTDVVDSFSSDWGIGSGTTVSAVNQPAGSDFADISLTHVADSSIPMTLSLHYVLRAGECGFHSYTVYTFAGASGKESDTLGQLRTVLRVDPNIFNNHSSELYWTKNMPLPADIAANSGNGDLQDSTFNLTLYPGDPYYDPPEWWYYTKYDYSSYEKNHVLHGVYGSGYGIWCIHTPLSKESWLGGPTKQSLMIHTTDTTPLILNEYFNGHYGQSTTSLTATPGWSKTYGPWFFYINQGDTTTTKGYQAMWEDAAQYSDTAIHQAFYDEVGIPGYTTTANRASVTGQITLSTGQSMLGTTVVLADNSTPFDRSTTGNQYWVDANADGTFSFTGVRPGTYRLSAYKTGILGDYHTDNVAVTAPSTSIASQVWTPPINEVTPGNGSTTVLQVGMPDRTAMEFADGDNYKHYGLFNDEALDFPNGVNYVFGNVSGMAPSSDRTGWYFTQWKSYKENYNPQTETYTSSGPTITPPDFKAYFSLNHAPAAGSIAYLTIAVASEGTNGTLVVSLNGNSAVNSVLSNASSSATRSGASGIYINTVLSFPGSELVQGTNVVDFHYSQSPIQYDAIKLEISPADATLAPQPDLTISNAHSGTFAQGGAATYSLDVSNMSQYASTGPVTVGFWVPWSLAASPLTLAGGGWTCETNGHVVVEGVGYECNRSDSLLAGGSYPPITVTGTLTNDAPGSILTTAVVSGGGDVNTVNNASSDFASVQLGSIALQGTIATKSGPSNARVWSINVANHGGAPAYEVTLPSFTLTQTFGTTCAPAITSPNAFPLMLGMISGGSSATGNVTIDFSGCPNNARFTLNAPIQSTGSSAASLVRTNQFQ